MGKAYLGPCMILQRSEKREPGCYCRADTVCDQDAKQNGQCTNDIMHSIVVTVTPTGASFEPVDSLPLLAHSLQLSAGIVLS